MVAMTDGGIETVLVFHEGFELPDFAAFPLLDRAEGRAALRRYYESFLDLAEERELALGTPTWRASRDWGARLGYDAAALARVNADAVAFVREVAERRAPVVVEGMIGPRGDGYVIADRMTADDAAEYHRDQIVALRDAGADRITALTLTYPDEAIGIVRAAHAAGLPVVPSFTVETDGRLPGGERLTEAIAATDSATDGAALFFMVNCAHPTHLARGLEPLAELDRIGGLRVNASSLSHAELDEAEHLDEGDPVQLGRDTAALRALLPHVGLLGGCCGTDARHVGEIVAAWERTPS